MQRTTRRAILAVPILLACAAGTVAAQGLPAANFEQKKDAYITQMESALQRYYDQMVRLNTRSQGVAPLTRAGFQSAKRDFMLKGERVRSLLDRLRKLSPQVARQYKGELDAAFLEAKQAFETSVAYFPDDSGGAGAGPQTPKEKRKANYIARVENALNNYNRQMVRLSDKTGQAGVGVGSSGFESARREFDTAVEGLRRLLAEVGGLTPEEARLRKAEVDAGLKRVQSAYEKAAAYVE